MSRTKGIIFTFLSVLLILVTYCHVSRVNLLPVSYFAFEPSEEQDIPATPETWKSVLLGTDWFGGNWKHRFGPTTPEGLKEAGCPIWRCTFTSNHSFLASADAVVIRDLMYVEFLKQHPESKDLRREGQMWVWVNVEAPLGPPRKNTKKGPPYSHLFNWTMTYHRQSELAAPYGHFLSINETVRPLRPHLMTSHEKAVSEYMRQYQSGSHPRSVLGSNWTKYVNKTRIVAWMVSHCRTRSRREEYVKELKRYIPVDIYGDCGKLECTRKKGECWTKILAPKYSFYLSFENSYCRDYLTEKVYNPLLYGIVPVVMGGADYTQFLPPHSYIDATKHTPKQLASTLQKLHNDPVAMARYHIWRMYLKPKFGFSFCELCHLLHHQQEPQQQEPRHLQERQQQEQQRQRRQDYSYLEDIYRRWGNCTELPKRLRFND